MSLHFMDGIVALCLQTSLPKRYSKQQEHPNGNIVMGYGDGVCCQCQCPLVCGEEQLGAGVGGVCEPWTLGTAVFPSISRRR